MHPNLFSSAKVIHSFYIAKWLESIRTDWKKLEFLPDYIEGLNAVVGVWIGLIVFVEIIQFCVETEFGFQPIVHLVIW